MTSGDDDDDDDDDEMAVGEAGEDSEAEAQAEQLSQVEHPGSLLLCVRVPARPVRVWARTLHGGAAGEEAHASPIDPRHQIIQHQILQPDFP